MAISSRVALRTTVAVVSFAILIGSGFAWATFKNFESGIPHGSPVPALGPGQKDVDGNDQNILLVGNDSRDGATKSELHALSTTAVAGANTDTMMVLHVPADGSKPTIISFPRDSWVSIPDNGKGKLNSAFGDGFVAAKDEGKSEAQAHDAGMNLTIRTLNQLTGLHIDHYVQVSLLGFYRISNAIGGVTVCLNKAQNASTDSDEFGSGYSGINLPKGYSVIKGVQALAFVRQRHGLPNGDLDRIRRQQYFLASAFHEITSAGVILNPFKLHNLLNAVGSSLLTDPDLNLLKLAQNFQDMSSGNIEMKTIPNDGPQTIYPDGVETSIVQVDSAAMPAFINKLIGKAKDSALKSVKAADPSSVTVDVLNGAGIYKWAAQNAAQLKEDGFKVNDIISAPNPATTTQILYPPNGEAQAKSVLAVVKGAELVVTSTVKNPTLILGSDGKKVTGVAAPSQSPSAQAAATSSSTSPAMRQVAYVRPLAKAQPNPVVGLGCIN